MESRTLRRTGKVLMRSYKLRMPGNLDLPVRVRLSFVLLTFIIMLLLSLLGFTNLAHEIINDKLEHFLGLGTATALFYLIFEVEEDARRIWIWRHFSIIATLVMCFLFGGIVSEIVQSLFPANLLGSTVGLYIAYMIERHHRHRREIARLYQPLNAGEPSPTSSEEDLSLPLHTNPSNSKPKGSVRVGNVWDHHSREELFGVGDDDMSDNENGIRR
ncbi:unnamed protein product [Rhizoctonia solani]|uniref:Uncharacterized protein n=1 Tax=Rhizoctonia solani TaxID=456999 RepID=A0A8H3B049_9AGAM|nr:unnamed protein product [Rhizoctonia solani]CAE6444376.1 unnamed protein product [Rhizoctonia solani]